jgi:hypothetical protein
MAAHRAEGTMKAQPLPAVLKRPLNPMLDVRITKQMQSFPVRMVTSESHHSAYCWEIYRILAKL